MNIEEFEALKRNPIEFVAELAARVDEKPDFGLARVVSEFMAANPEAANSIPIVTSAGDLQQHPPGEFVRLRCCFNTPLYEEMVAYRIAHEDKFYTAVVPYPIPFEPTGFDKNTLVSRRIIGVSSVPSGVPAGGSGWRSRTSTPIQSADSDLRCIQRSRFHPRSRALRKPDRRTGSDPAIA